jgi:V8-like Glu-specific endopeptidase
MSHNPRLALFLFAASAALAATAHADVKRVGQNTVYTAPATQTQVSSTIDFDNAQPMPLPTATGTPPSQLDLLRVGPAPSKRAPGVSPGDPGSPEAKGAAGEAEDEETAAASGDDAESQEFGTSGQPFTTNRVDVQGNRTSKFYPYRAAGKLYFNIGTSTYVCSASLIKPGVLVTAAHCVANFGASQFYSNWTFKPGYDTAYTKSTPYKTWTGKTAWVKTSYYTGTESCYQTGVICPNDVAIIVLNPISGAYPGATTGWFGYGWDGWGFNGSGQTLINQLGYPVSHDSGGRMQRNDSQGVKYATYSNNTLIGSLMTGGSSGGPWLNNLGIAPSISGISFGSYATRNVVVGVTSWGWTDAAVKQQGASPFTSGNIVSLVNSACTGDPAAC